MTTSEAVSDYWALTRTPAGNNVMSTYPESGARPDALALNAAYKAVHVSWDEAFAGDPHEVAGRFTAWVQAAAALSRNLAAERHRAPVFRQTLDTFIGSATRLASRTQATAQDPAAWARVFADVPGNAPASGPDPEASRAPRSPALPPQRQSRTGHGRTARRADRQGSGTPGDAPAPLAPDPQSRLAGRLPQCRRPAPAGRRLRPGHRAPAGSARGSGADRRARPRPHRAAAR